MKAAAPLALLLTLAACGGGGQENAVENTAMQLDNAAAQSDPAAAAVLENAADEVREQNSTAPAAGALEQAGNAAAGTVQSGGVQAARPPVGAAPTGAAEGTPPEKIEGSVPPKR